jgi:hypothetical protein
MNDSFTKLFPSLLMSSVWEESNETRIVWVTMLAIANQDGMVEASVPGLARAARVTREQAELALKILSSPDPDSKSTRDEGRRIRKVEGGWNLINYLEYRQKSSPEHKAKLNAERQKRWRERNARNVTVTPSNASNSTAEAEAEERDPPTPFPSNARNAEIEQEAEDPGSAVVAKAKRRDPFEQSRDREDVKELFEAWKNTFAYHGAKLGIGSYNSDADTLADCIDAYGKDLCLAVLKHAPNDGMVNGTLDDKRQKHDSIAYIFGNQKTFFRILKEVQKSGTKQQKLSAREAYEQAAARQPTKESA